MQVSKLGVLFLHGYPLDSRMWDAQVEFLCDQYHILRPDFSDFQWETIADLADVIAGQVQRTSDVPSQANPEKWIVCGLSMGGYVAFEFWKRHRELVAGLVLSNTKASADDETAKTNRRLVIERAMAEGSESVTLPMMPKLLSKLSFDTRTDLIQRVSQMMRETSRDLISRSQQAMIDRNDFSDELALIDVPVLAIAGTEDSITPADQMESMAAKIPQSAFKVIRDAGHLAPLENPDVWNEAFSAFVCSLEQMEKG